MNDDTSGIYFPFFYPVYSQQHRQKVKWKLKYIFSSFIRVFMVDTWKWQKDGNAFLAH